MTTIEGLGKKFQDARLARGLTLDEAARMTKIRPSRLAEIEGDDFSQFPSLAYAKGFLLIYGKFLDVDVTPYMEAFEGSDAGVTVDGYSYLQDNPAPAPVRAPIVRRRPARVHTPSGPSSNRTSIVPLILVPAVIIVGFLAMKLILNLQRLAPKRVGEPQVAEVSPTIAPSVAPTAAPSTTPQSVIASPARVAATVAPTVAPTLAPVVPSPSVAPTAAAIGASSPPAPSPPPKPLTTPTVAKPAATAVAKAEPEVRRAEPVKPEDLANAVAAATTTKATPALPASTKPSPVATASVKQAPVATASVKPVSAASPTASATAKPGSAIAPTPKPAPSVAQPSATPAAAAIATPAAESAGPTHVAIKPLKKTYVRVVVDDEAKTPAYERWLSPNDPPVEFSGQHINIKVLERDAIQIRKNGKTLSSAGDDDVTIE